LNFCFQFEQILNPAILPDFGVKYNKKVLNFDLFIKSPQALFGREGLLLYPAL